MKENVYNNQCSNCRNRKYRWFNKLKCKSEGWLKISFLKKQEICAAQDEIMKTTW